jgi:hypothetical protein
MDLRGDLGERESSGVLSDEALAAHPERVGELALRHPRATRALTSTVASSASVPAVNVET